MPPEASSHRPVGCPWQQLEKSAYHAPHLAALTSAQRTVSHDGTAPFPGGGEPPLTAVGRAWAGVTGAFVIVAFAGLAAAVWLAWGHGLGLADVLLAGR